MDLVKTYQETINALNKANEELAAREQTVLSDEAVVKEAKKTLIEREKVVAAREEAVKEVEDTKALLQTANDRVTQAEAAESKLSLKTREMRDNENRLYEISLRQKETEERLRVQGEELAKKVAIYKEEVKKQFFEELQKSLPR